MVLYYILSYYLILSTSAKRMDRHSAVVVTCGGVRDVVLLAFPAWRVEASCDKVGRNTKRKRNAVDPKSPYILVENLKQRPAEGHVLVLHLQGALDFEVLRRRGAESENGARSSRNRRRFL